jgi:hypothetical protein
MISAHHVRRIRKAVSTSFGSLAGLRIIDNSSLLVFVAGRTVAPDNLTTSSPGRAFDLNARLQPRRFRHHANEDSVAFAQIILTKGLLKKTFVDFPESDGQRLLLILVLHQRSDVLQ